MLILLKLVDDIKSWKLNIIVIINDIIFPIIIPLDIFFNPNTNAENELVDDFNKLCSPIKEYFFCLLNQTISVWLIEIKNIVIGIKK